MSFELVIPRRNDAVQPGTAAIDKGGNLRMARADLTTAGIDRAAAVLIDTATRRIALRAPAEDEPAVKIKWAKSKSGAVASVKTALARIGRGERGRFEIAHKDNLLIIQLDRRAVSDNRGGEREAKPRHSGGSVAINPHVNGGAARITHAEVPTPAEIAADE